MQLERQLRRSFETETDRLVLTVVTRNFTPSEICGLEFTIESEFLG